MTIALQPAFVLHRRPYRETSLIVELFTQDLGRLSVVARGIRTQRSSKASLLQPFMPLMISCYGKGDLLGLRQVEPNGYLGSLKGKNLHCGFYLNELLMRLLPKQDPHPELFTIYQATLLDLQQAADIVSEKTLRLFEKRLLVEVGYGLSGGQEAYQEETQYYFDLEQGFLPQREKAAKQMVFSGKTLNALIREDFREGSEGGELMLETKRLMRFVFASLLGRPLESRKLFESYHEGAT